MTTFMTSSMWRSYRNDFACLTMTLLPGCQPTMKSTFTSHCLVKKGRLLYPKKIFSTPSVCVASEGLSLGTDHTRYMVNLFHQPYSTRLWCSFHVYLRRVELMYSVVFHRAGLATSLRAERILYLLKLKYQKLYLWSVSHLKDFSRYTDKMCNP